MQDGIIATYQLTLPAADMTPALLEKTAEQIAVGQTIGTTSAGEELAAYRAQVVGLGTMPGETPGGEHRAQIQIRFPQVTVESDLGTLLAVLFGKLSMAGPIRLIDITVSQAMVARFQGPRYGILGVRDRLGVPQGPILMSIFKPCLGVPPGGLGEMYYTLARYGVDMIKDDEVLSDATSDTARRRLAACLGAADRAAAETGRRTLYAINLTGPAEELLTRARLLVEDGATALLFNYLCYGLPMLQALRADPAVGVPIVAHPALGGAFYGSPAHGVSPKVLFGQLPRLAGADMVLFPSPYGTVSLQADEAQAVRDGLNHPVAGLSAAFPVPSAGIQADMIPQIMADFGDNVVINAGTGIADYPGGAKAGVEAFVAGIAAGKTPSVV